MAVDPDHRTVSLYLIHPHRSKEAFAALIEDWQGILVSDGYGVYQHWVQPSSNVFGPSHAQCPGARRKNATRRWPLAGHGH